MTNYQFTSPKFHGTLNFEYDSNGILKAFEIDAVLTPEQFKFFLDKLPRTKEACIAFARASSGGTLAKMEKNVTFEIFYNEYAYKVGKKKAERVWKYLSKVKQLQAYSFISKFKSRKKREGTAIPYPATYLNNEPWED